MNRPLLTFMDFMNGRMVIPLVNDPAWESQDFKDANPVKIFTGTPPWGKDWGSMIK